MTMNQKSSAQQRFSQTMTTCSILSAIFVVWIHTYNVEVYSDANRVIYWIQEAISQGIARGAVPFFLMSSAYFLYSKDKTVSDVYRSRSKSILIPYLMWNAVYMVVFAVLFRLSLVSYGLDAITVRSVAKGLFLHEYNYAYWFMRDLIVLVALYPVLRWILSRGKAISFIGLGLLLVAIGCDVSELKSSVYYFLGAIFGYHYSDQTERVTGLGKKEQRLIICVLLAISGVLFGAWYSCKWLPIAVVRDLSTALLMFFVVVRCNIRIGGKFAALSFMIYSLHPLVLEVVEKTIYLSFPHNDLWMMIDYVVAPVICLGLIVGICFLWKKLLPRIYKLFNGGRI